MQAAKKEAAMHSNKKIADAQTKFKKQKTMALRHKHQSEVNARTAKRNLTKGANDMAAVCGAVPP